MTALTRLLDLDDDFTFYLGRRIVTELMLPVVPGEKDDPPQWQGKPFYMTTDGLRTERGVARLVGKILEEEMEKL